MSLVDTFVEVKVEEGTFLRVKETLSRIGIASKKDNTLYPSCYIFHKRGKLYITHFKELLALDGKETNFSEEDKARRNTIANLLQEWGLVEIVSNNTAEPVVPINYIKIVPFREKNQWTIVNKYTIGKKS